MDLAPKLNTRAICITDDPIFAALISSYFSEKGGYFAVFPFAEIKEPPKNLIGKIVIERMQKHVHNRVVALKPERVIFAGLNQFQKSHFSFPTDVVIEIDSVSEINEKLDSISTTGKDTLACRSDDICRGLFLAKKYNRRLMLDETVATLDLPPASTLGIFLLEEENDISGICTVNLAHASGAEIGLLPKVTPKQVYEIKTAIEKAGNREDGADIKKPIAEVKSLVEGLDLSKFKWITFLTRGIPYSLVLGETHATALLYRAPASMVIFDSLFKEQFSSNLYSALFFSVPVVESDRIAGIVSDETPVITNMFAEKGFLIVPLVNETATKKNWSNFVEYFPYDVLHIGSHGGGLEGTFNKTTLEDEDGKKHGLEYYRTLDFEAVDKTDDNGQPMIKAVSMIVPISYDGHSWGNLPEGHDPKAMKVLGEFMSNSMDDDSKDDFTVPVKSRIPHSKYIQCIDNIHQGQFHIVASQTDPFIFNNTCCSWFDMGTSMIGIGARAYIGTLWNIGTETAKEASEKFYELALERNLNLMRCCREMLKSIKNPVYKNIYVYWGLPWTRISIRPKKSVPATIRVATYLKEAEERYTKLVEDPDYDPSLKVNIEPILKFLKQTRSDLLKSFSSRA